jgi:hypothetical protein
VFALAYRLPGLPQRVILRLLTRCMSHEEFDKAVEASSESDLQRRLPERVRNLQRLGHGQSRCSSLATATSRVGRLSELVYPLVGQPKHARGIAGAQSQTTPAQHTNRSPGSNRGTPVLPICLLSEDCVRPNCLRSAFGQPHIINDLRCSRIVDEQLQRFRDSAARFVDRAALRVATPHAANRSYPPP